MNTYIEFFKKTLDFFNKERSVLSSFYILFAMYVVALFSLFRGNVNYVDDLGRSLWGYKGWSGFSRFSSDWCATFVHANSEFLLEISPIPQLIAIVIIVLASLIFIDVLSEDEGINIWKLFAVIPLGLNPYFLECFSYKFDSPYMALSILASVFPFVFRKELYSFAVATVLSMLVVCTTYQAALGIFPMLCLFYCLKKWQQEGVLPTLKILIVCFASFLVGVLIFKLFLMMPMKTYVSNSISIAGAFDNFRRYYTLVVQDIPLFWQKLILCLFAWFVIVTAFNSGSPRAQIISVVLCSSIGILLTVGFYAILTQPLFAPRAMFGFGALLAIVGVYTVAQKDLYVGKILCLIIAWCLITFASAYGNAVTAQKAHETIRRQLVLSDINKIVSDGKQWKIYLSGNVGHAPVIRGLAKNYRVIGRLVPITFTGPRWCWGVSEFIYHSGLRNISNITSFNQKGKAKEVRKGMFHDISIYEGNIIRIDLRS